MFDLRQVCLFLNLLPAQNESAFMTDMLIALIVYSSTELQEFCMWQVILSTTDTSCWYNVFVRATVVTSFTGHTEKPRHYKSRQQVIQSTGGSLWIHLILSAALIGERDVTL